VPFYAHLSFARRPGITLSQVASIDENQLRQAFYTAFVIKSTMIVLACRHPASSRHSFDQGHSSS
jgi:Cu2+-containing amine oxidase